uniref:C-type lectin domain-containing protein n=1 Tax=Sinocyclocheilus anshuiensis TaxID=1608454 RepID=A0A671PN21_9TELE
NALEYALIRAGKISFQSQRIPQQNNTRFVYVPTPMNWMNAQKYCRQQHHTELVSVRNEEENRQIRQLIPAGHFAYIGLFKDDYIWSDNSTSSFRNWDPDQPDESGECVAQQLRDSRLWDDQTCSAQKPFFCSACVLTF